MTENRSPELALDSGTKAVALQSLADVKELARVMISGGFAPANMKPDQVACAILYAHELGLKPLTGVQNIAVINGRPAIWGDLALGMVQESGLLEDIIEELKGDGDAAFARCCITRRGQSTHVSTFSARDAKDAGLWGRKGPWSDYPRRMLQMRARGFALRNVFPDVLKGIFIKEEAEDIPPPQKADYSLVDAKESLLSNAKDAAEFLGMPEPQCTEAVAEAVDLPPADRRYEATKCDELLDTIADCLSERDLDWAAEAVKACRDAGKISPEDRQRLGKAFLDKKRELAEREAPDNA